MFTHDLIIVGGGIAGSALAAVMAREGRSVLLLEQSVQFEDRVRGEWIAPWGVAEVRRVGLYDLLMGAGGRHLSRHTTYDEGRSPASSEEATMPLDAFIPGVPGPLCIGHPHHCQTLFDEAVRVGAQALRGVTVTRIEAGATSRVDYEFDGQAFSACAPIVVGADGRLSPTREAAGVVLHQDAPHHWFAGLLVDGAAEWPDDLQAIGTEGDFGFLAFPQGGGRVRLYGGYALDQRSRFAGAEGPHRFLEAFRLRSAPSAAALANATPAGPLFSYFNHDAWTDAPYAPGVVLIGDAAGWNDPIIGLGLSITYRDVRLVSDILKATPDWSAVEFSPYGEERHERMRRLRFTAKLQAALDMEFDDKARERRRVYHERTKADPMLGMHGFAVMAGPDALPAEIFTDEHRARVLNG